MTVEKLEARLPAELQERLSSFRRRLWRVKTAEAVFAAALGAIVSFLVVFGLDRFMDTPAFARGLILIVGTAGFSVFLPAKLHRWIWRVRSLVQVSNVLVRVQPDAGDRLLGIVELAEDEREQRASPRLVEAAIAQVAEDTRELDLDACVPDARHRGWGIAAVAASLIGAAAFAVPGAGPNALARWAFPWDGTPRYTFAQLQGVPDRVVVAIGEPFSVTVELDPDSAWSPSTATARYGDQEALAADVEDGAYRFDFPAQTRSEDARVRVGDAELSFRVEPLPRPELVAMSAAIELPAYLQYPRQERDVRGGLIHAVAGSRVRLEATISRDLAAASLGGAALDVVGDRVRLPEFGVEEQGERELRWTDVEGLSPRDPFRVRTQSVPDAPPSLGVRDLQFEQVVLDSEVVAFHVGADDDFGVREVGVEWNGIEDPEERPQPQRGEFVLAAGEPTEDSMDVEGAFCAQRLQIEPQAIELRAYTLDYRPDAERVYSAVYRMYVLDADQHMMWLTQRLSDWQDTVLEVRDQEERLHDRNLELRELPIEELDSDPMRREVARQAEAERANGRRLDALTDRGRDLIDQAIRNPQFNVQTLENWAAMLVALEGLANARMPSVAELLARAATAPSADPKSAPSAMSFEQGDAQPREPGGEAERGEEQESEAMPSAGNAVVAGGGEPGDGPPPTTPAIVDMERGADRDPELAPLDEADSPPPPPGEGRFGLAETQLMSNAPAGGESEPPPPESPAQQGLDEALEEQAQLLAEFNSVMDQIAEILQNLHGSTFVKRLQHAARQERKLASTLHGGLQKTFGEDAGDLAESDQAVLTRMAGNQQGTSEDLRLIEEDLAAYFDRVQEAKFKTVLEEMTNAEVVSNFESMSAVILDNYAGEAVAEAEYWTDELDRWAEMLVGPG